MIIGVPKEIKTEEYRVGVTPSSAKAYLREGHEVLIQKSAGEGAGFSDEKYLDLGCKIVSKEKLFEKSDLIIKVKEPLQEEYSYFKENQWLYTYLHLAADKSLTEFLLEKKICSYAYETLSVEGRLPLLKPMSEIAGRLAVQEGAKYLTRPAGGKGVLLGGVPGVKRGTVMIVGGGVVGINACKMAVGLNADVIVLDKSAERLAYLDDIFGSKITTLFSSEENIQWALSRSDLVIGAVLIPGAKAPKIITREHLNLLEAGSVIVDVAIDQGGCCETSRVTSYSDPIFVEKSIIHYCVANIPGGVAKTSTDALNSVTLPYGLLLANSYASGLEKMNAELKTSINTWNGKLVNEAVATAFDMPLDALD